MLDGIHEAVRCLQAELAPFSGGRGVEIDERDRMILHGGDADPRR
jgi:hypothetical protein